MRKKKAFTLVELLIVIAILFILVLLVGGAISKIWQRYKGEDGSVDRKGLQQPSGVVIEPPTEYSPPPSRKPAAEVERAEDFEE